MTAARTLRIDQFVIGARVRRDLGDLDVLAQSIDELGLLQPVVVTPDGRLIAGYRRVRACQQLGWAEIPVRAVPLQHIVRGEAAENLVRKNLLPSEAVAIARALEPFERSAAKARRAYGRARAGKLPERSTGDTRDRVARYVGLSGRTLEKAAEVVQAAEENKRAYGPLVADMDRSGRVSGVHRRLTRLRQAEVLRRESPPLPTGPFRVFVADPPWPYEKRTDDPSQRGVIPYAPMSLDAICALPVEKLAAADAVLWLWTTNTFLPEAFCVVTAWGFAYKTALTWVKPSPGVGEWLRGQTEHVLLAVRGRPTVLRERASTVLHAKRGRQHSQKPVEFYELVEAICPGSKLELFARAVRPGWAAWGLEAKVSA